MGFIVAWMCVIAGFYGFPFAGLVGAVMLVLLSLDWFLKKLGMSDTARILLVFGLVPFFVLSWILNYREGEE